MQLFAFSDDSLENIYSIRGRLLAIPQEAVWMGSMQGLVAPGQCTRRHAHHDEEQFVIIAGSGIIQNNSHQLSVKSGDVIRFSPGESHTVTNTSTEENLVFLSMWWANSQGALISEQLPTSSHADKHILIAPPATPNGNLHLGHIAGPYLAADIVRRHLLQLGKEVCYITGTDDNQSYVTLKAKQLQQSEQQTVEHFAINIESTLHSFHASPDEFYRPLNNQAYTAFVQDFFITLYENNSIRPQMMDFPYCSHCEKWLFEAHISGQCSHCNHTCGGGSCENCAMPNNGTELQNAYCKYCRNSPTVRAIEVLAINLQEFSPQLQTYTNQLSLPTHVRALVRQLLAKPLPVIAITHPCDWGIALPLPGFEQQRLCTWSEMAPAYLYAMNNRITELTLLFGFDNSFFYTILLPALFLAYDKTLQLPKNIIYNEFYLFENEKFSTSRGHAIWAHDIIKYINSDYLRYYLAATRPEIERTVFSYHGLISLINQDLVWSLSQWIQHLAQRIDQHFQNICPDGGEWDIEHTEFGNYLQQFLQQSAQAYHLSTFSPASIVRLLRELVLRAKKLAASTTLLTANNSSNRLDYQTSIVLELTAVKYYAMASFAIMPCYASRLATALGFSVNLPWENEVRLIPKNRHIIGLAECTFAPLNLEILEKSHA